MTYVIGEYTDSYIPVVDGVATCVRNYAKWLNENHCEAYVVAPEIPGFEEVDPFKVYRFKGIPLTNHKPYRAGLPVLDFGYLKEGSELRPSLVHAHSPFGSGQEALRQSRKYGIPLVATFHSKFYDDFLQYTGSEFIARKAVGFVIKFFKQADSVWTVSNSTAQTLREYGYDGDICIFENGTEYTPASDPAGACARVNEKYGLGADEKVMLFVGQQVLQKNLVKLLEAAALYRDSGAKFRLLMVGEGYASEQLKALARERGIDGQVIFTGVILDREELRDIYTRAQLFTFPSLYDNAPLVLREAAAVGCPPVLVEGSNAAESVREGDNGFLCQDDPRSIADAMARAFADDERRLQVGRRAQATLARPWEEIVGGIYDKYCEIIEEFAGKKEARR